MSSISSPFVERYTLFGLPLYGHISPYRGSLSSEACLYRHLKAKVTKNGWFYARIETKDKIGFPDIFLCKSQDFYLIEAKKLYKKKLVSIEKDLCWQYGQLAFFMECLQKKSPMVLMVGAPSAIIYLAADTQKDILTPPKAPFI